MQIDNADDFERHVFPGRPKPGHETLRLEFKRQLNDQRDAAIDIAAMMNADGGTLIYGVNEDEGPDGYKVASGLHAIDVDMTKAQLEAAIDHWLSTVEQRPEMFPLHVGGHNVLVVRVRANVRMVAVKAEAEKREGLVFMIRNNHGNHPMSFEQVERRIHGYAARAMRIRLQEFLDSTHSHALGEPLPARLYYGRRLKEPEDRQQNRIPQEWNDCILVAAGEWAATLELRRPERPQKSFRVEVPYELVVLAWWQPSEGVKHPGRPALLVDAHFRVPTTEGGVIEVLPLLHA